ncbi:MAG: hypothetical protein Q4B22_07385 [Eubacteriales bacterium]|nr:hypothetical protein [Eubacteriales bacterium]
MAEYRRRNVTNSKDTEYRPGSGIPRSGGDSGAGSNKAAGTRASAGNRSTPGTRKAAGNGGRRTAGSRTGTGTASGTRGTAGTRRTAGTGTGGTRTSAGTRAGSSYGDSRGAAGLRTRPEGSRLNETGSRRNGRSESETERQERIRRARQKKELIRKRKRKKKLIRTAQLLLAGIAVLAVIIFAVSAGVRRSKAKKDEEAAAVAAAHAAATQTVMEAADVLHLSFPVLTQDDSPMAQAVGAAKPKTDSDDQDENSTENAEGIDGQMTENAQDSNSENTIDGNKTELSQEEIDASADALEIITVSQFNKILQNLYDNNYVLVNIYSTATEDENGIAPGKVSVPKGKKPLIISQRDVSYEAGYNGHPDKLVLDSSGKVTCEYTAADGSIKRGDVDVIPCVEAFIAKHPDFSFENARGVIGLTGYRGVLGYQIEKDMKIIGSIGGTSSSSDSVSSTVSQTADTASGDTADTGISEDTGTTEDGSDSYESGTEEETWTDDSADTYDSGDGWTGDSDENYYEDSTSASSESTENAEGTESTESTDSTSSSQNADAGTATDTADVSAAEKDQDSAVTASRNAASDLITALKASGWSIACNSYQLVSYGSEYDKVVDDVNTWKEKVGSLAGDTDILLLPKGADLDSWSGYRADNKKFQYLKEMGYKIYCTENEGAFTWAQITDEYVRLGMHDVCTYKQYESIMEMN